MWRDRLPYRQFLLQTSVQESLLVDRWDARSSQAQGTSIYLFSLDGTKLNTLPRHSPSKGHSARRHPCRTGRVTKSSEQGARMGSAQPALMRFNASVPARGLIGRCAVRADDVHHEEEDAWWYVDLSVHHHANGTHGKIEARGKSIRTAQQLCRLFHRAAVYVSHASIISRRWLGASAPCRALRAASPA